MKEIRQINLIMFHRSNGAENNSEPESFNIDRLKEDLVRVAQAITNKTLSSSEHTCGIFLTKLEDDRPSVDEESRRNIESSRKEMVQAVREGFAANTHMQIPSSFANLQENEKREVVRLTLVWLLEPIDRSTARWFDSFVENEGIKKYLKHTISKSTWNDIYRVSELRGMLKQISDYEMLNPNS